MAERPHAEIHFRRAVAAPGTGWSLQGVDVLLEWLSQALAAPDYDTTVEVLWWCADPSAPMPELTAPSASGVALREYRERSPVTPRQT
jgi:hypothetical protein